MSGNMWSVAPELAIVKQWPKPKEIEAWDMHAMMGPRGASNRYIFNRRPTELFCGQIWHGVVKQEDSYSYVISTGTRKLELPTL